MIFLAGFLLFLRISLGEDNWPVLSNEAQVAIRTQRDVSYAVPIDQSTNVGVSTTSLVFDTYGYSISAMPFINTLLNTGTKTLVFDIYYNNYTSRWQLCPAPFPVNSSITDPSFTQTLFWNGKQYDCQPNFTINLVMQEIQQFIETTNTNMNVNYIEILYRLRKFDFPKTYLNSTSIHDGYVLKNNPWAAYGNSSLSDTVQLLSQVLFTPDDLQEMEENGSSNTGPRTFYNQSDETFPDLKTFIYTDLKRTTVAVIEDDVTIHKSLYNFTSSDKNTLFIDELSMNSTVYSIDDDDVVNQCIALYQDTSNTTFTIEDLRNFATTAHFRYISDNNDHPFDDLTLKSVLRCGLSPLLNSSKYNIDGLGVEFLGDIMEHFFPLSFWSWSSRLLAFGGNNSSRSGDEDDDRSQEAYKCVNVAADGWQIGNCYEPFAYACQSDEDPIKWHIEGDKKQYFDAYKQSNCPEKYTFGYPKLSIEMLSLMTAIEDSDQTFPVWIDINDVTVTNCFVSGGPYAECPYQRTVTTGALARLVAPSFVIAVFILLLILLEKIARVNPIQTNKKRYWKKRINEYNKEKEYEGVPS